MNFRRVSKLHLTATETEKNLRVLDVSCIVPGTENGMNQSLQDGGQLQFQILVFLAVLRGTR